MELQSEKLQYWRLDLLVLVLGIGGFFQYGIQVSLITFPAVEALGQSCFLIFVVYGLFSAAFMIYFVPETKGKSILKITEEFNKLNYRKRKSEWKTLN